MEEPGYPGARSALVAAGARIHPVPVDDDGLDVDAGARRARGARLVYVTPSHQFPLGVPMSLPRRLALLEWASARRRVGDRGRLRQRVPLRRAADPVPARPRRRRPRDLRRQLQQDAVPGAAARVRDRAVRPPRRAAGRAPRERGAPPRLDQAVLADFMQGGHYDRHLRRVRAAYRERLEALQHAAEEALRRRAAAAPGENRPARRGRPRRRGCGGLEVDSGWLNSGAPSCSAERVFATAAARGVEVMPLLGLLLRPSARPRTRSCSASAGFDPTRSTTA